MDRRDDSRGGGSFGVEGEYGGESSAVLDIGWVKVERRVEVGREVEGGVVGGGEDADAVEDFDMRVGLVV